MRELTGRRGCFLFAAVLASLMVLGCDDDAQNDAAEGCTDPPGPMILPHLSPVSLGVMYPLGNKTPDATLRDRTPYEWVLLLQAPCENQLNISKVCLIGDDAKGGDDVAQFSIEGPTPMSPNAATPGALRITYDRQTPNSGDDMDNVALVIESNAKNFPTLVVPICARVVADGSPRPDLPCLESPVSVAAGTKVSLCP